jgi:hypothetical protein
MIVEVKVEFRQSEHPNPEKARMENIKRAKKQLKPARNIFLKKKYTEPNTCQIDGSQEFFDGYCSQHYVLSSLLLKWTFSAPRYALMERRREARRLEK